MQTMGKRIAEKRRKCGWTQEVLAERLNVTAQVVSKWETGASCPDLALLPLLARTLHTSIDQLMTGEGAAAEVGQLRIRVTHESGEQSEVTLPIALLRQSAAENQPQKLDADFGQSGGKMEIDLGGVLAMIERGMTGILMCVKSGNNTVEVIAE